MTEKSSQCGGLVLEGTMSPQHGEWIWGKQKAALPGAQGKDTSGVRG